MAPVVAQDTYILELKGKIEKLIEEVEDSIKRRIKQENEDLMQEI